MRTLVIAARHTPSLLRPMCEHCGVRRAQVGVLCCTCDEDPEEKAAFLAKQQEAAMTEEEMDRLATAILRTHPKAAFLAAVEEGEHADALEALGACPHCATVRDAHGHCDCIF